MSQAVIRAAALRNRDYKYGNWTVSKRRVYYKHMEVANVRPKIRRYGIGFIVTIIDIPFSHPFINGSHQTHSAIRRAQNAFLCLAEFRGIPVTTVEIPWSQA